MKPAPCVLLALALLTVPLAGCIAGEDIEPASETRDDDRAEANPWQEGLEDTYEAPDDVVVTREADERRANLAEPGDPMFAEFDAAFQAFMEAHDLPTGQVALMHEGDLRYTRGYGSADAAGTEPANAETMFRVASISKPMTAAVVSMQIEQGLYNGTDPVFCVGEDPAPGCRLDIDPHPAFPIEDERLGDVEVQHLLDHTGGWGRTMDPIFFAPADAYDDVDADDTITIAEEMGIESPPPGWRLAQYVMGQPLADDPGESYWYCNVCYLLAGLIAEDATGASIQALLDAYVFEPLEVDGDVEIGHSLPEERNPRETFYPCEPFYDTDDETTASVFNPDGEVCWPDGGWSQQVIGPLGGITSTASAIAAVYEVYAHHGATYADVGPLVWEGHGGSLPATATMTGVVEAEGTDAGKIQYVALFNQIGIEDPTWPYLDTYQFEDPLLALSAQWGATEAVQEGAE